ncbi:hypothetical protein H4582DRAFT_2058591 [Lactarius indigo]|nr:hypothetical protein H4582DRAFT_2058591 [Lactarius indigo]
MDNRTNPELTTVLQCLSDNGYSVFSLFTSVLSWCDPDDLMVQSAWEDLELDAVNVTQSMLRSEVEEMTKKKNGLHFSASTVTVEQIELTFMPQLAGKLRLLAPSLWGVVFTLLGALDECRSSVMVNPSNLNLSELFQISEQLLGDLGEDDAADENIDAVGDDSDSGIQQEDERRPWKRSRKDVSARNTAIRVIMIYSYELLGILEISCVHQYHPTERERKL